MQRLAAGCFQQQLAALAAGAQWHRRWHGTGDLQLIVDG